MDKLPLNTKEEKEKNKKPLKLTTKRMINNYIHYDPNNPKTYLNKVQSYISVHPNAKYDSARVQACREFAKPNVKQAIEQIIKDEHIGVKERVASLAEIIKGKYKRQVVSESSKHGTTTTTYEPTAREIITAVKELNDIEGIKEQTKAELNRQDETIRELRKMYLKEIERSIERLQSDVTAYQLVDDENRETGQAGLDGGGERFDPSDTEEPVLDLENSENNLEG